jgi:hypothetical protein
MAFISGLNGNSVLSCTNDQGLWSDGSGSLALVARSGNQASGLPSGVYYSGFPQFGMPALNNIGQVAFGAYLGGSGVDLTNYQGIWVGATNNLTLVARNGSQAPGTLSGVKFASVNSNLFELPLNDAGQIAFTAPLTGSGVDANNNQGLWSGSAGNLALVARKGDQAPGTPAGVNFLFIDETWTLKLNNSGQTAFRAGLTGNGVVLDTNHLGIWATDQHGDVQLIARMGDLLEVTPGDFRTIAGLEGSFRLNNVGELAFNATFTDGSSGIFVSNRVAIPEPSAFALAVLGTASLLSRTHRRFRVACLSRGVMDSHEKGQT